jgi:type IV secretion system protein VirD4
MNKFGKVMLKLILFLVGGVVVGYVINCLAIAKVSIVPITPSLIFDTPTYVVWGVFALVFVVNLLNKPESSTSSSSSIGSARKGKTATGEEKEAYFSARLVSLKELRTNSEYHFCYFNTLKNQKFDGIPLRAERIGNHTEINMQKPIHTLVIGTTGSGKTTMLVDPTIQILAQCGTHPSMIMSDPKGELYAHNAQYLRDIGYDVQCINLREPNQSSRVNPIEPAYDKFQRAHNLIKEVKVYKGKFNGKMFEPVVGATYGDEWYVFEGVAYPDKNTLKLSLQTKKQELINSAYEDIQDIALALSPTSGQDPVWSDGARDFIRGIMMAMLEDSLNPELGMTRDRFTLFNVSKIAGLRDQGDDNMKTLKEYFSGRPETSEAVKLANTVVATAASTAKGFLSHVSQAMNMFDQSIGALTSSTDLDFSKFADRPTALFIIIPDERDTRHGLANIYITQLYKALIERANKDKINITLPRHVYFLLDEFGNLPKIQKMKSFITAGRSRGIFLMLVVQDYTQLNSVYGEQDAATIKNNCNIHIYIGTKDQKTREEFSKNIGEVTLEMKNVSSNSSTSAQPQSDTVKSSTNRSSGTNTSTNLVNVPLISPNELDHLKPFEVVINSYGHYSMRTTFTPTYKNPDYKFTPSPAGFVVTKPFDEVGTYYDIKKRNKIVLKNDDDDGDFDFDFSKFKNGN